MRKVHYAINRFSGEISILGDDAVETLEANTSYVDVFDGVKMVCAGWVHHLDPLGTFYYLSVELEDA